MKTYLEKITINETDFEIAFSFSDLSEPIDIDMVNGVPADYLTQSFINDCEEACVKFLKDESSAKVEALSEAMGDEQTRGN